MRKFAIVLLFLTILVGGCKNVSVQLRQESLEQNRRNWERVMDDWKNGVLQPKFVDEGQSIEKDLEKSLELARQLEEAFKEGARQAEGQ